MSPIRLCAALALAATLAPAQAGEVYGQIGLPGAMLGYAQPLNDSFTLRGDLATVGTRHRQATESGIAYDATLKADRAALFADWFPFQGSFRLTGGVNFNSYKLDLVATGAGGTLTIGSTTYATTAADRLEALVKFAPTTPYLGFGWGHQTGSGLRFVADVGAMLGRATVTTTVSGPLAQQASQADIDAETAQLRDGVGHVRVVPQISLGIGYSF